jgi:molybdopterin converting factor small subunit
MSVTIHLPGILSRHAGGARSVTAEGETVGAVLAAVERLHPELGRRLREASAGPNPFVVIYLNDEDIRFRGGRDATVAAGDELSVVSAIAGG